jgi:hypothetical protein
MGLCIMCAKNDGIPQYCQDCVERYGFVNDKEQWEEEEREKYNIESESPSKSGVLDEIHPDDYQKVLIAQNDIIIRLLAQQNIHEGGVLGAVFSNLVDKDYKGNIEKIKRARKFGDN